MTISAVVTDPNVLYDALIPNLNSSPTTMADFISNANEVVALSRLLISIVSEEDSVLSSGELRIHAITSKAEDSDSAYSIGKIKIGGSGLIVENNDTIFSTTMAKLHSSAAIMEINDTIVFKGLTNHKGRAVLNEGNDTVISTGNSPITGREGSVESPDSIESLAKLPIRAHLEISEGNDQTSSASKNIMGAIFSAIEGNDQVVGTSLLHINADSVSSDTDAMTASSRLSISSSGLITEANDLIAIGIHQFTKAVLLVIEEDDRIYEQSGRYRRVVLTNISTANNCTC